MKRNYNELSRFGKCYSFEFPNDLHKTIQSIAEYNDCWNQYNPRKKTIRRYGLSLVNLSGVVENGPDIDSLYEYNKENGTNLKELSFSKKTSLYDKCIGDGLKDIEEFIGRSHIIKLPPGGFFPVHRDARLGEDVDTFRLILPIEGCNAPRMYFIVDDDILNFEHGKYYFIDTCRAHTVFNASPIGDSIFAVFNVSIEAITKLGKWMTIR